MKPLSLSFLILVFVALLAGSYAFWDEMRGTSGTSETIETENDASVVVDTPVAQSQINSPVTVTGKARGYWYFEASFPVEIIDSNGKVLGTNIAQAQGEWMTEEYVPFTTTVTFAKSETKNGFILFKKDNPSGLSENDATIAVPITFAQ